MKKHAGRTTTPGTPRSQPPSQDGGGETARDAVEDNACLADQHLIDRCLAGDVAAWEKLYSQNHPGLLVSIEILLGYGTSDQHLVDEIAARIWYALVANDGELLARYDAKRGARLSTFLRALAKDEVSRHFRTERRRRNRELRALREKPKYETPDDSRSGSSLTDFLGTLTPHERSFCDNYLLAATSESGNQARQTHTSFNIRQLSSRIRRKLLKFLDGKV